MTGSIISLQIGTPRTYVQEGKEWTSAIFKSPVEGTRRLGKYSFEGDGQADLENHGGADKAVCVYSREHYPYWEQVLGRALGYAAFGENLTVTGLTEDLVRIGDIYNVGTAIVQISQPRQPCYKLGYKHGRQDLPVLVQNTGYTGYYFRVLQEGMIGANDKLELQEQSPYGVTVAYANRIMHHERENADGARQLLAIPELSDSWRAVLVKRLTALS